MTAQHAPGRVVPLPDRAAVLARQRAFAGVGAGGLQALAGVARPRRWLARATLFQRGDAEAPELYLLTEGRVRLSLPASDGRELSLRHATAGDMIGELAVLGGTGRTADATAVTDVAALVIGQSPLQGVMRDHPEVAQACLRFICGRLQETTEQLEAIALLRLDARLARFLRGFLKTDLAGFAAVDMPFTQTEIADLIGASRPKVNQAFARLEQAGAIERRGAQVWGRPDLLAEMAEGGA